MLFAVVLSAVLAVCLVEAACGLIGAGWLTTRLARLKASLSAFQHALDDADRQRIITRAGLLTCWVSVVAAVCILALLGLIFLPLYLMQWAPDVSQTYFASLSVFSLIWWIFRRKVWIA